MDTCAIKNNCVYTYAGRSQYFLRVVEDRLTIERTVEHVYGLKLKCREREIMYRKQKKKKEEENIKNGAYKIQLKKLIYPKQI